MIPLSYIPDNIKELFKGVPGPWKGQHFLIFRWFIILQATCPGRKILKKMAFFAPAYIREWRLRRLLTSKYWNIDKLLSFYAHKLMSELPRPENKILFLFGDSSEKPKSGEKNPLAQKGRKSKNKPYFFGIRFVVLMAHWDVYRIPVAFRIILPKEHPDYKKENELFREMLEEFQVPEWVKVVIVGGDSAYASKENMKLVQKKDRTDSERKWYFIFAIAKTWKLTNGKSLRNLAYHLPRKFYKKTWIPRLPESRGRKYFWIFAKRCVLNHAGDVTIVMTKTGRNVGPKKTKMLVTNLTGLSPRQIVCIYNRRWSVEILFKELKSGLGLGQHQVTKNEKRIKNSIGIAVFAYLFLVLVRKNDIKPSKSWSIFQLQNNLRLELMTKQIEHNFELKMKNFLNAA